MPCDTRYYGRSTSVKPQPWARTQIDVDQEMIDEFGIVHGHIKTANTAFLTDADHLIIADLYDPDGVTTLMSEKFLYIEKDTDEQLANDLGAYGVAPVAGCTPEEAINLAAQQWMTENYREYVHSHEDPQNVFIVGGGEG